ncbi:MAG: excinuclease ABC subunit UvrC [Chlorobi bacterium]|nr:excinuclease ABC subunit UvrC [Chlorobiota bacterium]
MSERIKEKLAELPAQPGIYQFLDKAGNVLYVGKAKNLKNRVSSYFSKHVTRKTGLMLRRAVDLHYIVTANETEAYLLENVLIKKHQPKFNILLKDDKTYPWIVIRNEPFPRVEMTRDWVDDGSEYFGPYTSVRTVRVLLDLIHDLFPIRTCRYDLSPEKIRQGKFKVCLEYHLGRCNAPCVGREDEHTYRSYLKEIRKILRGNFRSALEYFRRQMTEAAARYQFEKAQEFKEKLEALERYQARSTVVNPKLGNVEVYSLVEDGDTAYVNFMEVANGTVIRVWNTEVKRRLDESPEEILGYAVREWRRRFPTGAREIIVPFMLDLPDDIKQTVPKRGDKRKLLELSEKNARYYRLERRKHLMQTDPARHTERLLERMKEDLFLPRPPRHIECFDISHTQGVEKTAACVVFKDGKPDKKSYRHFTIKSVEGNDDYASLYEAVYRRYHRLKEEGRSLPDLVVIDGGKGQLSAARKALEDLGLADLPVISIAKRLEEIYRPGDPIPLHIDKLSETLRVIRHIRDEAHRFGLRLHRKRRQKRSVGGVLTRIPGVGEKTAVKLLKHFKSVKRIREAPIEEVAAVVGPKTARRVKEFLEAEN